MSHLTLAASEDAIKRVFNAARDNFSFLEEQPLKQVNKYFWAGFRVGGHLEGGKFYFYESPIDKKGSAYVEELDVVWDSLRVSFGIDIPEACVGGWCIVPTPLGCAVRLPRKCFFKRSPDVSHEINLDRVVRSEVSFGTIFTFKYFEEKPGQGAWKLFLGPRHPLNFQPLDIPDIIGDLIDRFVKAVVDKVLGFLPQWARDVIESVLGSLSKLIRRLLDIGDDVREWLSRLLGVSLGITDIIAFLIIRHFAERNHIYAVENPYEILAAVKEKLESGEEVIKLPAVKAPIAELKAEIAKEKPSDKKYELVLRANIGG